MTLPLVVNRRTTKNYDVYVGRPTKWGNPYHVGKDGTRPQVLAKYVTYLRESGLIADVGELRGKTLACWCAPELCHADVLVRLANP